MSDSSWPDIVFLFGAGASSGSGDVFPYSPPVGSQLFDEILKRRLLSSTIESEFGELFRQSFELGMERVFEDEMRHSEAIGVVRAMAACLNDFCAGPSNLFSTIVRLAARAPERILLSTINYDLLVECCAGRIGRSTSFRSQPSRPDAIRYLKLHGSINFLPDTEGVELTNVTADVRHSPGASAFHFSKVRIAQSHAEIRQFCDQQRSLHPIIAMYAPSKRGLINWDFIRGIQADWQRVIGRAKHIVIVGARVHPSDSHIWEPLGQAAGHLYWCGREQEEFESWAGECGRGERSQFLGHTFMESMPAIEALAGGLLGP